MREPSAIAFVAIPEASGARSRTSGGLPRVIPDETEASAANRAAARIANWEVTDHLRLLSLSLAICCSSGRSGLARFPRSLVPDERQASWKKLHSAGRRLNQAEVLFEQPL